MKKKILVAMSGGVDSSVVAALMIDKGHHVEGVTIEPFDLENHFDGLKDAGYCSRKGSVEDARKVCGDLGIKHHTVNFTEFFAQNVVKYFVDEYLNGRTPNPCVHCNPLLKWGELTKVKDKLGLDFLATGHYANITFFENYGRYSISKGKDTRKDQSYFLWRLSQKQLSETLFPLGNLEKTLTRELAEKFGLSVAKKAESQEVCFIPEDNYRDFLRALDPEKFDSLKGGEIIMNGKSLGTHNGFPFYTIGQRKGLGVSHKTPLYVHKIDSQENKIFVGAPDMLYHKCLIAKDVNLMKYPEIPEEELLVKIRYRDKGTPAHCKINGNGELEITFREEIRAITPGQSVVIFEGDSVIAGGVIDRWS